MELIKQLFDLILHVDIYVDNWVHTYDTLTYLILFAIIFCETGLVVTPFLPGDSLLFAAGAIAAKTDSPISIFALIIILLIAAFFGDNTNFFIGRLIGKKVYEKDYKLIKKEYLNKTHAFYERHGGKTLVIARFMPIIRTFAPFVAGVGTMKYLRFISFSIMGNILWVVSFLLAGFYFGQIDFVKRHFSLVIVSIIFVSIMPPVITVIRHKYFSKS